MKSQNLRLSFASTSANTSSSIKPNALALSAITMAMFHAIPAMANDVAAQQTPDGIERITIQGEKITRDITDTVSSVQVIGGREMQDSVHQDISELLQRVANVDAYDIEDAGFTIRGVNNAGTTNSTGGDLASVYLDGAVLSSRQVSAGLLELFDLQQIEVFRGPQSTVQGRNALAGAMVVSSAKPVFDNEGHVQFRYGEDNTYQAAGAFNFNIEDDVAAVRLSYNKQHSDNDITNLATQQDDWAQDDSDVLRARFLYQPLGNDDLTFLYTFMNADVRKGNRTLTDTANPFSRQISVDHLNHDEYESQLHILDVSAKLNDQWRFSSVTAYSDLDEIDYQERDMTTQALAFRQRAVSEETTSQEFRFNYDNGDDLSVLLGAYYFDNSRRQHGDPTLNVDTLFLEDFRGQIDQILMGMGLGGLPAQLPLPGLQVNVNRDGTEDIRNTAIFASADWKFAPNWLLNVGLRYDREKLTSSRISERSRAVDLNSVSYLPPGFGDLLNAVADGALAQQANDTGEDSTTYDAWLPKVALNYYWSENTSTGFSVSKGYRSGGFIENQYLQQNVQYDPEFTTNYELSLRSVVLDNQLQFQANAFYVDWKDMQVANVQHSANPGDSDTQNAAKAAFYGVEFQAQYVPNSLPGLNVFATLGANETEFKEFSTDYNNGNLDLTGNEFPLAPSFNASTGFTYRNDSGWFYSLEANYRGESFANLPNYPLPADAALVYDINAPAIGESAFIVNGRLGYETEVWDLYLWAQNLLDEAYFTRSPQERAVASTEHPFNVGKPRRLGVQLNYRF